MRIGQGFDAHRFAPGRRLVIGGVDIPYDYGMEAHSDGDVLLHAITDAILGAAGEGDLGRHFPDTDPNLSGVDSRILLRRAVELAAAQGLGVGNVDATVIAQKPKLAPYIDAMKACIADDLLIAQSAVNIKATTTEKMGFTGRGEGIAAMAVVLLVPQSDAAA
ncbi:2-C-methyl-D-erythritol 2,4-cyclodiphosphate synthase [Alkalilimnicola ehrlichii]|uniref:2-C-methyl-D-erythritol 2,4-cyclodiphosphate synthase n=1 Tax=Alkalilimnicola ehrlichii TaxID=351052 RepID=A0A3E0WPI6_9GAMM|nr:2-C-methyl-D-erythritol 2,4-cyclodiphosphate synthase [Alkalilimnicola ehrlichii]RFA28261.1 2-C-methyl-D-erythritol 2,4-cyclodiphosphate synthase [Alkalilimnicola ehrlichii]RFA34862.1 2-C-methyl-D-erythritol 2,4-cyclodiphosphate synthase [Alkalilimnicola ehrlichii]